MSRLQTQFDMNRRGKKRQNEFDLVSEIREDVVASLSAENSI